MTGQPPNALRLSTYDPEAGLPASLAPCGPAVDSPEEVSHSLREIAERLLLDGLRTSCQPPELRTCLGQLPTLGREIRGGRPVRPPIPVLLDGQIPNETGMRAMFPHDLFLLLVRYEPVAEHESNVAATYDIYRGGDTATTPHCLRVGAGAPLPS
jgi:hypothetical protein